MSNVMPIATSYPGVAGSPYPVLLSFAAKAAGTYTFMEANFTGLGANLPCYAMVTLAPASGGPAILSITSDSGTTWKTILNAAGTAAAGSVTVGGALVLLDGTGGQRVVIATAASDV